MKKGEVIHAKNLCHLSYLLDLVEKGELKFDDVEWHVSDIIRFGIREPRFVSALDIMA